MARLGVILLFLSDKMRQFVFFSGFFEIHLLVVRLGKQKGNLRLIHLVLSPKRKPV